MTTFTLAILITVIAALLILLTLAALNHLDAKAKQKLDDTYKIPDHWGAM